MVCSIRNTVPMLVILVISSLHNKDIKCLVFVWLKSSKISENYYCHVSAQNSARVVQ